LVPAARGRLGTSISGPLLKKASTAALVLLIAFTCNMVGRGVGDAFMVFVLPLTQEFGWTRAQVASVYSLFLIVTGLGAPLTGMLIDRWGPRVVYPLGLVLLGSSCFIAAHLTELWQFRACIGIVGGMGTSMLGMVPASMLISRWFRDRMSTAMGVAYAGFGTGTIALVPLAQTSIDLQGWRDTYFSMGVGLFVLMPLLLLLPWKRIAPPREAPVATPGVKDASRFELLKRAFGTRAYWQIVTLFAFTSMTTFSVITQVVPFFVQSGLSPLEAATAFGTAGLLSVFGIPFSGWLGDRMGFRPTVTASFVLTLSGIVALMAFAFHPARWLVVAWVLGFGTMMGARGPIVSSLAARHFHGAGFATIYGTMFGWMSLAGAFGSLVSAFLFDVTGGYKAGLLFSMATVFLAVSPFWMPNPLAAARP
jgi:MFS family permease